MPQFMVQGICMHLDSPVAHFATNYLSTERMYPIVWDLIGQLEGISLKVMVLTADGTSFNRSSSACIGIHQGAMWQMVWSSKQPTSIPLIDVFTLSTRFLISSRQCVIAGKGHGLAGPDWCRWDYRSSYIIFSSCDYVCKLNHKWCAHSCRKEIFCGTIWQNWMRSPRRIQAPTLVRNWRGSTPT